MSEGLAILSGEPIPGYTIPHQPIIHGLGVSFP